MWCPYYGYGQYRANIAYNLGVIANRTNIFDVICIQPETYYHDAPDANVDLVYESAHSNEVVDYMEVHENALFVVFSFYIETFPKAGCPDLFSTAGFLRERRNEIWSK